MSEVARARDLTRVVVGHPDVVIVPAEALHGGPDDLHLDDDVATLLRAEGGVSAAWIDRLLAAIALRWRRVAQLAAVAPRTWFPPRLADLVVVRAGRRVRPYYQPLPRASWLVHEGDFDPDRAPVELGAYVLCFAERVGLVGDAATAYVADLAWWLSLDDAESAELVRGVRASERPDAAVLRLIADSQPWMRTLHDLAVRPPPPTAADLARIPGTDLLVPPHLGRDVAALLGAIRQATAATAAAYARPTATAAKPAKRGAHAERVIGWLRDVKPRLLIAGARGEALWDPTSPNHVGPLRSALAPIDARAADSLVLDLEVVDVRSRRFVERLVDSSALPLHTEAIDPDGGVWIDPRRRLVAVGLVQPGLRVVEEPAPPLHRWLLAARAAHEWAHLLEDAGGVAVPAARVGEHEAALQGVREAFGRILADTTPVLREVAAHEAKLLEPEGDDPPEVVLARTVFRRIGDYRANLVAREVLEPEEVWAYARVNARTHALEGLGPFAQLARHAIEVHYLTLAGCVDPPDTLFRTTFFADHFVAAGELDARAARALFAATGTALACWEIDRSRFVHRNVTASEPGAA